jgi:hypothetical protein
MAGIEDSTAVLCEKKPDGKRQRDLFFALPSKIILNEKGTSFFAAHSKTLHCFETADGGRHFGFYLEKAGFSWLKKLLLNGYLKKMEIQVKDVSACRTCLEDAVKLVFFSMFRQRINMSILKHICDSPMVRAWNRAHPKRSISPGMKMAKESLKELLNARAPGRFEELRIEVYNKIVKSLSPSFVKDREDSRDLYNFIAELVFHINPLVFFVLAGSKAGDAFTLIQTISGGVIEFVHRFDIVNLASLFTIELVSAAERSALVRMLENTGGITGILENPDRRKSIMQERRFRGSTVVVAVPEEIPRENRRLRFRLSVYNDGSDAETERRLMEDFAERSFSFKDGRDLEDFLKISPGRRESGIYEEYEDNGLCFYHLNLLQDQCRKNRILLDTAIKNARSGRSVVTTLWFGF